MVRELLQQFFSHFSQWLAVKLSDVNAIYCHIAQGANAGKLKQLLLGIGVHLANIN
jgi:hypothetical protein